MESTGEYDTLYSDNLAKLNKEYENEVNEMNESQLLLFRCGGKEYGIPAENVVGIIDRSGHYNLSAHNSDDAADEILDKPLLVMGGPDDFSASVTKVAIMLMDHNVEMTLIVDEIVEIVDLLHTDEIAGVMDGLSVIPFKVWQFSSGAKQSNGLMN